MRKSDEQRRGRSRQVLLVAVVVLLPLAGCGDDGEREAIGGTDDAEETTTTRRGETTTTEPTTTTDPGPDPDDAQDLVVDAGLTSDVNSIGTRYTSVGVLITNPNADFAAYEVSVTYNLLGPDGAILDTDSDRIPYIPAGATVPTAPLQIGFDLATEPTDVDASVVGRFDIDTGWDGFDGFSADEGIELTIAEPAISEGSFGDSNIAFTATNPSDMVVESVSWDCVYKAGGTIVGGDSSGSFDPIAPDASVRIDSSLTVSLAADEIICRAYA